MPFIALICITVGWYHIGRFITERFVTRIDPDFRDGISLSVGFGLLGFVLMIAGYSGGFNKVTFYFIAFAPFVFTIALTLRRLRNFPKRIDAWSKDFPLSYDRILLGLIGILFLLDLINCANAAVGWDAAVHHYAFPKAMIHAGRLIDYAEIPFSYYPSLGEMIFTLGLGVGSIYLAGALSWIFLLPLSVGMLALGKRLGSPRIGLWSLTIFLGAPMTFDVPFSGLIDIFYFTYYLLALALLLEKDDSISTGRLLLIGILIGCASSVKHLGLLFLIAFVPLLFWTLFRNNRSAARALGGSLIVILISLLIPLPWYIRSYIGTGDPLFPFLGNLLKSAGVSQGAFSLETFARTDYPRNIVGFIIFLWHLTMNYWSSRPWYWAITPAWLALVPLSIIWAFFSVKKNGQHSARVIFHALLSIGLIAFVINFFLAPAYPRYMYPTWLCFSLVSAYFLSAIRKEYPKLGTVLIPIVLILPFSIVFAMSAKRATEVIPQFFSERAKIEAIQKAFPGYDTFLWANENLDFENTLILSTDPKIYYLNPRTIIAKPGIESPLIANWKTDLKDILENWRELGVTHFILDTTLISVKHGFGIDFFSSILENRDAVWLDIVSTRAGAEKFGIGDILTDEEFLQMSALGELRIVKDGPLERHLLTQENMEFFKSLGEDWRMADTVLRFIEAGILQEKFRSGPGGGLRIYEIHLPDSSDFKLPDLPDVTKYCLPYSEKNLSD
ncbi:MAG: hypothetical protein ABIC40_03055 [bacterium]